MARLAELRKTAKEMGIPKATILRATTASALEKVIADSKSHDGNSKPRKKGAVRKAVKKAVVRKKRTTRTTSRTARTASTRKASAPAKSRGAKAKRPSNSTYEKKGGRNTLDSVDYTVTEGWNAREGSAPDRIIKALKRFKGNRAKVFNFLAPSMKDFVNPRKSDGSKRTKAESEAMLRYRISRTAWDFAMRTGQHKAASNRVEYGTGGTGTGSYKPKKATRGRQTASKPPARRGRPPGSKNRPKVVQKRTAARKPTTRKRGRPRAGSRR